MLVSVCINVCVCFQVCSYSCELCVNFLHVKEILRLHVSVCKQFLYVRLSIRERQKEVNYTAEVTSTGGNKRGKYRHSTRQRRERPNIQTMQPCRKNGNRESEHEIERDHKRREMIDRNDLNERLEKDRDGNDTAEKEAIKERQ